MLNPITINWKIKGASVYKNKRGTALSYPWSFGIVYKISLNSKTYWIKCFTRNILERKSRIEAITKHLHILKSSYFIECSYLENSIQIPNQQWVFENFPVIQMERCDWLPLNDYLEKHGNQSWVIQKLKQDLLMLFKYLKQEEIAHGDLQHGNIMICKGWAIKLVDYDGMYIPWLNWKPMENWLPDYQHPLRKNSNSYNKDLDRFSEIIIWYIISLLEIDFNYRSSSYEFTSHLLFNTNDYTDPDSSRIFADIEKKQTSDSRYSSLPPINLLKNICVWTFEDIPTLEDFLQWKVIINPDIIITLNLNIWDINQSIKTAKGKMVFISPWIQTGDVIMKYRWEWNEINWNRWDLIYKARLIWTTEQKTNTSKFQNHSSQNNVQNNINTNTNKQFAIFKNAWKVKKTIIIILGCLCLLFIIKKIQSPWSDFWNTTAINQNQEKIINVSKQCERWKKLDSSWKFCICDLKSWDYVIKNCDQYFDYQKTIYKPNDSNRNYEKFLIKLSESPMCECSLR